MTLDLTLAMSGDLRWTSPPKMIFASLQTQGQVSAHDCSNYFNVLNIVSSTGTSVMSKARKATAEQQRMSYPSSFISCFLPRPLESYTPSCMFLC